MKGWELCGRSGFFPCVFMLIPSFPSRRLVLAWVLLASSVLKGNPEVPPNLLSGEAGSAAGPMVAELTILTTPEGADLPAAAVITDFPLLVRLFGDSFDFSQAGPEGGDLRFSDARGTLLAHQIDSWDPPQGTAGIWVRVPRIDGNARQTIRMHWGNADAPGNSDAAAVFDASNGYLGVWHMNGPVVDATATLDSEDTGTAPAAGIIGEARHFPGGKGIFCGENIDDYPAANDSHSTEAWFRAGRPNVTLVGWGNEGGGRGSKVRMQLRSPPHLHIDSDFSDVKGTGRVAMGEWIHVMHTHRPGQSRIYINGRLDAEAEPVLDIKRPARLWIGGWYHHYDFVGELDEVRVSSVARTPEWVRLQYENQKPLQTLVGHPVQSGGTFSVSPASLSLAEGQRATLTAEAGGALKLYWILKRDGREEVVATDRFSYILEAGRVSGDTTATLQVKAIYPDGVRTRDIPVTITEAVSDPVFTLEAPATWDARTPLEIEPRISNAESLAGEIHWEWSISPIAVMREISANTLILKHAFNSGPMLITATASNGGEPVTRSVTIMVTEPESDPWVGRVASPDEKPEDGQFYARDDSNEGTLIYNGTLAETADEVFLKVLADGMPYHSATAKPAADGSYRFAVKLRPGLIRYEAELGSSVGGVQRLLHSAKNLVCGDVFLVNGQSNAVATDWGSEEFPETSEWIRSFGSMGGGPPGVRWGNAIRRTPGDHLAIGYWAFDLAKHLVATQKVPICIINGAVGGSRIDQHQRSTTNPADSKTIYGRLLGRVREARLTHGVRGVFWHQGENDQGADGPTGGFGWESYRQFFIELAAAWQQDFPNLQHLHVFQIWPKACSMGIAGSDDRLREVQRQLPSAFSKLSILSTLGIEPGGGCHYPAAGYAAMARLVAPLVERDHYGKPFDAPVTAPNLISARFAGVERDEILLEFDQPVRWQDSLGQAFSLDGERAEIAAGRSSGGLVALQLKAPSPAGTISYINGASWDPMNLLRGENGIAALSFCEVPLELQEPGR